ncbi:MFS family permease [Xanthomonas campestris]|nr:MFS family permease [Xanthomonas campestris]
MLSALLVGGTFMGTVTIAMPAARAIAERVRFNMLAVMTAAYGVGQILGPLLASRLYAAKGTFDTSLYIAAAALILAGVLCIAPRRAQQSESMTDGRLAGSR